MSKQRIVELQKSLRVAKTTLEKIAYAGGLNLSQAGRLIGKSSGSAAARARRLGIETPWDPHAPRKAYLDALTSDAPQVLHPISDAAGASHGRWT